MADSGPRHYQIAEEPLKKAQFANSEAERARHLHEAHVHATLALVAATVQGGQLSQKQLREWQVFGVKA